MASAHTILLAHSSAGLYGADRQLELIATGLDAARYRPLVVLAQDGPLRRRLEDAGVETLVRPLAVLRRASLTPAGIARVGARVGADALALGRLARARGVALVHSNTSVTLGGAAAAARLRVPHLWHVREIYAGFGHAWPLYRRLLRSADVLACVSEATRAQFAPADARARVLYDGLAMGPPTAGSQRARERLGLTDRDFACLVAGRVSDWKGQDLLLRALAAAPAPDRAIALIAGDAWPGQERQLERVTQLARRLGVAERVRMLGFRDDIGELYAGADVVVVPSTRPDPLPNSALEAAAAGACVVAARHGGLPEIVHDGVSGRLFAPGDASALATLLGELAADPAQRRRLGDAAAADVGRRFAPARLRADVQELSDELLDGRR